MRNPRKAFTTVLEQLPDALLVASAEGRIVAVNDNLVRLTGYTRDALLGACVEMLIPGTLRAQHITLRTAYLADGRRSRSLSDHLDITLQHADRTAVPVDIALRTVSHGGASYVIASVRDASRRRFAERLVEREQVVVSRLEDLNCARSDFVSRISHELRTPLASVIGYVEILADAGDRTRSEYEHMLSIIDRNARRLLALIDDLLTVSLVDAGEFSVDMSAVDLTAVVHRVCETVAPAIGAALLDLIVHTPIRAELRGDVDQLERALLNLVSNSVKFTAPGGQVIIAVTVHRDEIEVSVTDNGCGIPQDEQSQLFDRFFRSTRSHEREVPGTGLGLFIVDQIIKSHRGNIDLISDETGTLVTLRLPRSVEFGGQCVS